MKDLNLIPRSFKIQKKNRIKKIYLSILIISIGFFAALAYIIPVVYENNLKSEKILLEQQVSQTHNYVEMEKEFNSLKSAVEQREKEGKLLASKKVDMPEILNAIELAAPDKLFIQNIDTSGEAVLEISLKGVAENERIIASFIRNLMDDGYFEEVTLSNILNKQGNNGSSFEISLTGIRKNDLVKYKNWDSGFTIGYPEDWIIKEETAEMVLLTAGKSMSSAQPAWLKVTVEKSGAGAKSFAENRKAALKAVLKQFELGYSSFTRCSNVDAYKLMYYAEEDNIRYQYMEICAVKNNKAFIATYRSDADGFSNKARTIDRILKSFNID